MSTIPGPRGPEHPRPGTPGDPTDGPSGFDVLRASFDPVPGYLNAATLGLPPRPVVDAMRADLDQWQRGLADAAGYDGAVDASRAAFARIVGVTPDRVAVGTQVSVLVGLVAASLPDGAEVLTVDGEFASVSFPFMTHADRGVKVRHVPLEALADEVRPSTALVAFSVAQSNDGRVADVAAVAEAARQVGALSLADTTQAVGWLPVHADDVDLTVCAAYKWLCGPRGTAFLTLAPGVGDRIRPIHAGWYAGDSPWGSVYGPAMELARDARRFDVSPAWLCWVGTAPALELFAAADPRDVLAHDTGLADAFRAGLDLEPAGRAVVALPDPDGTARARLEAAGCVVAGRAGAVRIAFHVWNDIADVERALDALGRPR